MVVSVTRAHACIEGQRSFALLELHLVHDNADVAVVANAAQCHVQLTVGEDGVLEI